VPRYSPLPPISIDPRNEAELVQRASQRVYDASNQTLNDFSSGNPLSALLEGQAFAAGEFLFWANQLPQSILIEWLGPFLGAMRRLGTAATARLLITIPPSSTSTTIPVGTNFTSNANLNGGVSSVFISAEAVTIPAGETTTFVSVYSQFVGAANNCPAASITGVPANNITGLTATNPQPAVGGSDVETYQEVQERFFTLIRRRNPVSAEDWQNFFIDLFGVGTITSVQPNRPNQGTYNYTTDYLRPNGQVSFFVLGPGGVELTQDQLERGQNIVNFSVPVESQAHLYPMTLSQVQYNITLEVDANGTYGSGLRNSALNFRNRLYDTLNPGTVFPVGVNPTVSDVDAAFYGTFPTTERFQDPHIELSAAYNTPPLLESGAATYTQVYDFIATEFLLNTNDLVTVTRPVPVYYPVLAGFTPVSATKPNQTVYGNLVMKQIRPLLASQYDQGDVVFWSASDGGDDTLRVILQSTTIETQTDIITQVVQGRISAAKIPVAWTVGNTYVFSTSGVFNPDLVSYDYIAGEFQPDSLNPYAVGTLIWQVSANFTLVASTDDLTGAAAAGLLGTPVTPQTLIPGTTNYLPGTWVMTPQVGSGPDPVADPYYNYVDLTKGVVNKYAYVVKQFNYVPDTLTVSEYFDSLVAQGSISEIVVQNGNTGLPIFKYKPRFPVGTYLEYRETNTSPPSYYVAASYFTPSSTRDSDLVGSGKVIALAPTNTLKASLTAAIAAGTLNSFVRMFTFFKGDRTFFRQGSKVLSYTATSSVNPLFQFYTYLENGIFVPTEEFLPGEFEGLSYIPFFNPDYTVYAEDTIVDPSSRNLFRVIKAFSPTPTVTDWTNTTVANTARIQEYSGNLLRYVDVYTCEQDIFSQLGKDVSSIKLGVAQITLVPRDAGRYSNSFSRSVFVWEPTTSATEVPQLSYTTGTTYPYTPPTYGSGTFAL
jgi:hypothetical protein